MLRIRKDRYGREHVWEGHQDQDVEVSPKWGTEIKKAKDGTTYLKRTTTAPSLRVQVTDPAEVGLTFVGEVPRIAYTTQAELEQYLLLATIGG